MTEPLKELPRQISQDEKSERTLTNLNDRIGTGWQLDERLGVYEPRVRRRIVDVTSEVVWEQAQKYKLPLPIFEIDEDISETAHFSISIAPVEFSKEPFLRTTSYWLHLLAGQLSFELFQWPGEYSYRAGLVHEMHHVYQEKRFPTRHRKSTEFINSLTGRDQKRAYLADWLELDAEEAAYQYIRSREPNSDLEGLAQRYIQLSILLGIGSCKRAQAKWGKDYPQLSAPPIPEHVPYQRLELPTQVVKPIPIDW